MEERKATPSYFLNFSKNNKGRMIVNTMLILIVMLNIYDLYNKDKVILSYIILLSFIFSFIFVELSSVKINKNKEEELIKKNLLPKTNISSYFVWFSLLLIFFYMIYTIFF